MRCREALDRLNRMTSSEVSVDRELQEHLRRCPDCARQAEAARELSLALSEAAVSDDVDRITWAEQVRRVADAASRSPRTQPREISAMSALKRQFSLRPRLSLSLAAAAVVLLAVTLIPFKFDQTVGFEVAVAGVDRDLALDQDKLQAFLVQHGLGEAHVSVQGCDTVCSIVVTNLATEEDARTVEMVFEQIGERHVITLNAVTEEISSSVVSHAIHKIFVFEVQSHASSVESDTVLARFGSDVGSSTFKWVGADSTTTVQLVREGDSASAVAGVVYIPEAEINFSAQAAHEVISSTAMPRLEPRHWLNDTITDAARTEFAAQGWEVSLSEDKTTVTFEPIETDGQAAATSNAVGKSAPLPEGFFLAQNYPNPFNPTTSISYGLPQTEQVSLKIFNVNGQLVRTLVDEIQAAGEHEAVWNGTTDSGDRVASGVYLYRLTAGETTTTRKMTLLK